MVERRPERVAELKYEDLKADTVGQLARVCDCSDIAGVFPKLLDQVVGAASKEEMANLQNPNPHRIVVRMDLRPSDEWYGDDDRRSVAEVRRRQLKYTFGYTC